MKPILVGTAIIAVAVLRKLTKDRNDNLEAWPAYKEPKSSNPAVIQQDEAVVPIAATPANPFPWVAVCIQGLLFALIAALAAAYRPALLLVVGPVCTIGEGVCVGLWWLNQPPNPVEPAVQPAVKTRSRDLSGVWLKDKAASDSMEEAMDATQLNFVLRRAIKLIKGVEIQQTPTDFKFSVLSGILWFKVTETYPMDGSIMRYKRRDLRPGQHRGWVTRTREGHICIKVEWDDPLGGRGSDVFYSPREGTLHADTVLYINGRKVTYRTVYHKQT